MGPMHHIPCICMSQGRCVRLKTRVLSSLVHIMQAVVTPNHSIHRQKESINQIAYK